MKTFLCCFAILAVMTVSAEDPDGQVQCFKNIEINGKTYYDVLKYCIGDKMTEDVEFHECAQKELGTSTDTYPQFVNKMARTEEVKKKLLDTYNECEKKEDTLSCVNEEWGKICKDDQVSKTEGHDYKH